MAPPQQYTSDAIIAALIASSGSAPKAAAMVGCTADTIYLRADKEPEIAQYLVKTTEARTPVPPTLGRKPLCTDEEARVAIIKHRGILTKAARSLGYNSVASFNNRVRKTPALRQAAEEARYSLVDNAEAVVADAVDAGDVKAAQFVLTRLGKDRGWTERKEIANAHLHVHTAAELPQDLLERALAERLGVDALPESPDDLAQALEADFEVVEDS